MSRIGRKCMRVMPGSPIAASEWSDPALANKYSAYIGKPRCTCAVQDDKVSNPGKQSMSEMCRAKGLPLKVGNHIFTGTGDSEMAKRKNYPVEELDSLAGDEELRGELAAAIDKYNLMQTAIGSGYGAAAGLAIPFVTSKLPSGGFWDWVKAIGPGALLGGIGVFVGQRNPVHGAAIGAIGGYVLAQSLLAKFTGISADSGMRGLGAGYEDLFGLNLQLEGPQTLQLSEPVDDEELMLPGGDSLDRLEPMYATESQEVLGGLTLVNEDVSLADDFDTFDDEAYFMEPAE